MWDKYALIWDLFFSLFRRMDEPYRRMTVEKLGLGKGDTVLDLACGTGLNFEYIEEMIGEEGLIIGLDFSRAMLERANEKKRSDWKNIDLIQADAANIPLQDRLEGVVCTWAMVSIPDYQKALTSSVESLKKGKSIAILDFRLRTDWIGQILNPVFKEIFSATNQDLTREPWKDMEKLLSKVKIEMHPSLLFFPLAPHYIASGLKERARS